MMAFWNGKSARLAWVGVGASVVALAFTVRPVHASVLVFVAVLALGLLMLGAGVVPSVPRPSRGGDDPGPRAALAGECRRLANALGRLSLDRERQRPRQLLRNADGERQTRWRAETVARYRTDYRDWAMEIFEEAVACRAASPAGRRLVDSPGGGQLHDLEDLFREAAERLERRRVKR